MSPATTRLLTTREVARHLHLHVNTIKRLGGELPFYRVCARGDRRYDPRDVDSYLRSIQTRWPR